MKPARVFAGLTASTILTASLALTPQAVADPTTPTSGDDTGTAPTSPYNYAAIGDSATVAGSWFHPEKTSADATKRTTLPSQRPEPACSLTKLPATTPPVKTSSGRNQLASETPPTLPKLKLSTRKPALSLSN